VLAVAGNGGGAEVGGITPNSTSRVTIMHDRISPGQTTPFLRPRRSQRRGSRTFSGECLSFEKCVSAAATRSTGSTDSNSEAAASLGQATTSTTASFQLAPGTG